MNSLMVKLLLTLAFIIAVIIMVVVGCIVWHEFSYNVNSSNATIILNSPLSV